MRRTLIRIVIVIVTFFVSLAVADKIINKGYTDNFTADIAEPQLPIAYLNAGNYRTNMMQGYLTPMNSDYMRVGIMPLEGNRKVSFGILLNGQKFTDLTVQVRTLKENRLVESSTVTEFYVMDDLLTGFITLKDLIEQDTEYGLNLLLTLEDGRCVTYYTRVLYTGNMNLQKKMAFAAWFSESTRNAGNVSELRQYMEINKKADNSSLNYVDIHSSMKQLGWGSLQITGTTEPMFTILDITEDTVSLVMRYLITYIREGETVESAVQEVFRLRESKDRMRLLNYERTMEDVYTGSEQGFRDSQVFLGITNPDPVLKKSADNRIIAYVQSGGLYVLNTLDNRLARVFSFIGTDGIPERKLFKNQGYRILSVEESGDVCFLLYGYISRGRSEGSCGVEVYHYSSSTNTVEELCFIGSEKSPEVLTAQIDRLTYMDNKNRLYIFLENRISCIHLDDLSVETLTADMGPDSCRVSASHQNVVWQVDGELYNSQTLTLMNLGTGMRTTIEAGAANYILPIGFIGEDLVYGVAKKQDVARERSGSTLFPMFEVRIQDEEGRNLMNYSAPGMYVTECRLEEGQIYLERVMKDEYGRYVSVQGDQIVSSELGQDKNPAVVLKNQEIYQKTVNLQLPVNVEGSKLKKQIPGEVTYEGSRLVEIGASETDPERFYVYLLDGSVKILSNSYDAVKLASEKSCVALNKDGTCIWRKERLHTKNQIMAITGQAVGERESALSVAMSNLLTFAGYAVNVPEALRGGQTPLQILKNNMDGCQVLDLTGCSLESVLYYPDREIPVLAVLKDGSAVLIIGFNEYNIVIMNPLEETPVYKMGMNDAAQWFEENGNCFLAYVME